MSAEREAVAADDDEGCLHCMLVQAFNDWMVSTDRDKRSPEIAGLIGDFMATVAGTAPDIAQAQGFIAMMTTEALRLLPDSVALYAEAAAYAEAEPEGDSPATKH